MGLTVGGVHDGVVLKNWLERRNSVGRSVGAGQLLTEGSLFFSLVWGN